MGTTARSMTERLRLSNARWSDPSANPLRKFANDVIGSIGKGRGALREYPATTTALSSGYLEDSNEPYFTTKIFGTGAGFMFGLMRQLVCGGWLYAEFSKFTCDRYVGSCISV